MLGSKIVDIIKESSKVPNSESTDLLIGEVTSTSPLKVKVDNRYEVGENFLLLSTLVQEFEVDMTVDHNTEDHTHEHDLPDGGETEEHTHQHQYVGRKTFLVHLGLKVGEKVMLIRVQKGQKFIIIDRLR